MLIEWIQNWLDGRPRVRFGGRLGLASAVST